MKIVVHVVTALAFVITAAFAVDVDAQVLVAPEDGLEVEEMVEVVLEAEPGSSWFIIVDDVRVGSFKVGESGVATQNVWLGSISQPRVLRVERTDGSSPLSRRLVPPGWVDEGPLVTDSTDGAESTEHATAASAKTPNVVTVGYSPVELGLVSLLSTFVGFFLGYFAVQPFVNSRGFEDGRPTVSGADRKTVQFIVSGGVLVGVSMSNLLTSFYVLDGSSLLPSAIPLIGVVTLVAVGFSGWTPGDDTIDGISIGFAYGGALMSAIALYMTSPGSWGSGAIVKFGAVPTDGGAVMSIRGSF